MKRYGLIGYPLSHSFSQKYFTEKFKNENIADSVYEHFSIESIKEFPALIANHPDFMGLNVTIPYKEQVIPYLDRVAPVINDIKAVNTIKFIRKNDNLILEGHNTDVYGFEMSLAPLLKPHQKQALILGTGGASKATLTSNAGSLPAQTNSLGIS